MWKAAAGRSVSVTVDDDGPEDWETDPDFEVRNFFFSSTWHVPLAPLTPKFIISTSHSASFLFSQAIYQRLHMLVIDNMHIICL